VLAEAGDQPYLVASLHGVCERLGGVTRRWRSDRMSTVCHPESGDLTASFAEAAKYYGVAVDVCPSRRGWRKGVVEKANHSAAQRWWRTLPDEVTPVQAQGRLDGWCVRAGDARGRVRDGVRTTVGALAAAEPPGGAPGGATPGTRRHPPASPHPRPAQCTQVLPQRQRPRIRLHRVRRRALHPQELQELLRRPDHPEVRAEHRPRRLAAWQHDTLRPALPVNNRHVV
jgi:hypothetical protein